MTNEPSEKLEKLIVALQELQLTGTEIADILWLAQHRQQFGQEFGQESEEITPTVTPEETKSEENTTPTPTKNSPPPTLQSKIDLTVPEPTTATAEVYSKSSNSTSTSTNTLSIKVPDASALPQPLKLSRALRPLMQKIPSGTEIILDEEATANRIAEERIRIPVLKSSLEPAFDLALLVDESNTMIFWRKTIEELKQLLETHGAFRDVQTWGMVTNEQGEIRLQRGTGKKATNRRLHKPREIIDPSGKRIIWIVSDCVCDIWRNGKAASVIKTWGQQNPTAIVQMLPQWLWLRTGLSLGATVQLGSLTPRIANQGLLIKEILLWDDIDFATGVKIPVLTLEPELAKSWSEMVAGKSYARAVGFVFPSEQSSFELIADYQKENQADYQKENQSENQDTQEIVSSFRLTASPAARKLASLLSAAPIITLPIVRLIQKNMLSESQQQQVHVAEVFLGGIFKPKGKITSETNPDDIEFTFINEEARDSFLSAAPTDSSLEVLDAISKYFAKRLNKTLKEFNALLRKPEQTQVEGVDIKPFAIVTAKVLKRLGGDYVRFAEELEEKWTQTEKEPDEIEIPLETFEFNIATIKVEKPSFWRRTPKVTINYTPGKAQYFTEKLADNVTLEMVSIPGDTFLMGSPKAEEGSDDNERPQHEVTVQPFFMGKYTITQAQWKVVAGMEQFRTNRELNPDPSRFKGDNLPVECVSWYDAVEFCDRISKYTRKKYRLPSEAEWEYACRGGTTTPFHFGETITPELANYNGNYVYGSGKKGEYLEKTTHVGSFKVANSFGLYDMHGNVWEWCIDKRDYSIKSRECYPSQGATDNDNQIKSLRGGCWSNIPDICRSASRGGYPDVGDSVVGFRVVFVGYPRRTL
ncbi:MAG: formylglycine-generating enzyme family protein [Scytonematopsis contorta HA4267-MV1]|jgi:formylglycine-generating enzyme required for sulfatase activity|nr:formylglycine-generating enzyme family protein [Scytonematopsis contorta HA4267-MV1]